MNTNSRKRRDNLLYQLRKRGFLILTVSYMVLLTISALLDGLWSYPYAKEATTVLCVIGWVVFPIYLFIVLFNYIQRYHNKGKWRKIDPAKIKTDKEVKE